MWDHINRALDRVFNVWLWPVEALDPLIQLCWLALPLAIVALLIFKYTSNQRAIENTKNKIKANLLEFVLFKDDLRVLARAQAAVFSYALRYLGLAIVPLLVLIVPFSAILAQVESRFAYRSLEPGETAILSVTFEEGIDVGGIDPSLQVPAGLLEDSPPLRAGLTGQIHWRLRAAEPGLHVVRIGANGNEVQKVAAVASNGVQLTPVLQQASDPNTALYPGEPALADGLSITRVEVAYPRQRAVFAGLSSASWIFAGLTIVAGFALRGPLGVAI